MGGIGGRPNYQEPSNQEPGRIDYQEAGRSNYQEAGRIDWEVVESVAEYTTADRDCSFKENPGIPMTESAFG